MSTAPTSTRTPEGNVRPEVLAYLRPIDRMGEGLPRRLNFFALAGVLVQAGCPFTVVPDAYWEEATDTEGFAIAAISCPCGQKPTPGLGMPPVECQCGRFFFYAGPQVLSLAPPRPA